MLEKNTFNVSKVVDKFNFDIVNEGNMDEAIATSVVYLPIKEAYDFVKTKARKGQIFIFGKVLSDIFDDLDDMKETKKIIEDITSMLPSAIIYTNDFKKINEVKAICKKNYINLLASQYNENDTFSLLSFYLAKKLTKKTSILGTALSIFGVGVLIKGNNNVEITETILSLIKSGSLFMASNAIDARDIHGRLYLTPNKFSKNFLETKGLGITNIKKIFGVNKLTKSIYVDVVIEFKNLPVEKKESRVLDNGEVTTFLGCKVSSYKVPISNHDLANIVELIVNDFKLRKFDNYNSSLKFIKKSRSSLDD